jgi:hypothetical protein
MAIQHEQVDRMMATSPGQQDGPKSSQPDVEAQTPAKSDCQKLKDPFSIDEPMLWTVLPLLSTFPLLNCWEIVVHLLYWIPFGILLAVYGARDKPSPRGPLLFSWR